MGHRTGQRRHSSPSEIGAGRQRRRRHVRRRAGGGRGDCAPALLAGETPARRGGLGRLDRAHLAVAGGVVTPRRGEHRFSVSLLAAAARTRRAAVPALQVPHDGLVARRERAPKGRCRAHDYYRKSFAAEQARRAASFWSATCLSWGLARCSRSISRSDFLRGSWCVPV